MSSSHLPGIIDDFLVPYKINLALPLINATDLCRKEANKLLLRNLGGGGGTLVLFVVRGRAIFRGTFFKPLRNYGYHFHNFFDISRNYGCPSLSGDFS